MNLNSRVFFIRTATVGPEFVTRSADPAPGRRSRALPPVGTFTRPDRNTTYGTSLLVLSGLNVLNNSRKPWRSGVPLFARTSVYRNDLHATYLPSAQQFCILSFNNGLVFRKLYALCTACVSDVRVDFASP